MAWKDYKTTQNSLICSAHNKTEIFMMISKWKFHSDLSVIGAHMKEQS